MLKLRIILVFDDSTMAIEIVDFPIENGGSFHSYVNLPEGIPVYPS